MSRVSVMFSYSWVISFHVRGLPFLVGGEVHRMGRFGWIDMSGGNQHPVYAVIRGTISS
jgi:hypothetical protein